MTIHDERGRVSDLLPESMRKLTVGILGDGVILLLMSTLVAPAAAQTWTFTGNLNTARANHAMFLLSDGRVLAAGELNTGGPATKTAELYNPATGIWTFTGSTTLVHTDSTAVRLQDGRVLIIGGRFGSTSLNTAEIYNPATGTWSVTGSMNQARVAHTATLLPNGKVLVTGGFDLSGGFLNSAEIYNPATGTWSFAAAMPVGAWQQTATLLPDGRVLVAGGENYAFCFPCSIKSAFIYDPGTNTWSTTGTLNAPRAAHRASLLSNGKVLVAGGAINADGRQALNTAELYDPASGTWSFTGMLNAARNSHTMTVLADGKVLVAGGFSASGSLNSVERYDPATGIWTVVANLNQGRSGHAAALLANGKVLVAGGAIGSEPLASAELFGLDPSRLCWADQGGGKYFIELGSGAASKIEFFGYFKRPPGPTCQTPWPLRGSGVIVGPTTVSVGWQVHMQRTAPDFCGLSFRENYTLDLTTLVMSGHARSDDGQETVKTLAPSTCPTPP